MAEPVARPHPEPVVLNIGGGFGALVVRATEDVIDLAVEISPTGADDQRVHQHILERPLGSMTAYAAVFDRVAAGAYTVWTHGQARHRDVQILDGQVTDMEIVIET